MAKRDPVRLVNYCITLLAVLVSLPVSRALCDDYKTVGVKEYRNARVSRVEPDGVVLVYKSGVVKVYFAELPEEIQKRFGYDPAKAENNRKSLEDRRIEEQKATVERKKNVEAHLKEAEEEFHAAQQRAAKTYQTAAKGTLSGQVFVSTKGAENFKLGAVQVALFSRDAMDTLVAANKKYADYKIEQLRKAVAEAEASQHQAEATAQAASDTMTQAIMAGRRDYSAEEHAINSALEAVETAKQQYSERSRELAFCYSGGFYFALFQSPIRTAETDADGKFAIDVPQTGAFVVAAQAKRSTRMDTEQYYWLQPVTLEGHQQLTQNLSNNNLTSATETSSLIHTRIEHAISGQR
jgi:hypothetical protein